MKTVEAWVLSYLVNSLWQVPLVFGAAWATARLARRAGAGMEHRVWVAALLLEALLPGCDLQFAGLWRTIRELMAWMGGSGLAGGEARVAFGPATTSGAGSLRLPVGLLTAGVLAAYGCCLVYFAGRLAWGLWRTESMRRQAKRVTPAGTIAKAWERCAQRLGIDPRTAEIATSSLVSGPVTVGIRRRVLLVPEKFLEALGDEDLNAVLAHELAHMRRRDFEKNLLYRFLSLPGACHPVLWLTGSRLAESREMVCDAMAAETTQGRESYARSLLRLASLLSDGLPANTLPAIGFLDANIFERRVMNLTQMRVEVRGIRRAAIAAVCGMVALAACASAVALRVEVNTPATQKTTPTQVHVKNDYLKIVHKVPPVYPVEAKASKNTLNGPVFLRVVIGKDGSAQNVTVSKSLRQDYDSSAVEAVRQWRWQPYLLNGNPIEVITTVTITYSLSK